MKYTPRKYFDYNLTSGVVTTAKVGKKIVTTDSGDPAASDDTGEGYIVGSMWLNTTSGEQFVATGVGAEDAVWMGQKGENINLVQWVTGGTYGWVYGGVNAGGVVDDIERLTFSSEGNTADQGEMSTSFKIGYGGKSSTKLFSCGGVPESSPSITDSIHAFPQAAPFGTATDWGNLTTILRELHGSSNSTYKFLHGGASPAIPGATDTIQKFAIAATADATDVGELTVVSADRVGVTDSIGGYGYAIGGANTAGSKYDIIERYSLSSDENGTDIGETSSTIFHGGAAHNDLTNGFVSTHSGGGTTIDKFAFGSPASSSDVGETNIGPHFTGGHPDPSSTTTGYMMGGLDPTGNSYIDTIHKFSFTAPYPSADVGEITQAQGYSMGSAT